MTQNVLLLYLADSRYMKKGYHFTFVLSIVFSEARNNNRKNKEEMNTFHGSPLWLHVFKNCAIKYPD